MPLRALSFVLVLPLLAADDRAVLDAISADSLRGHVSFLASDLLEGRATPSRGLDLAAEYIAAQFRRAGLTPAGDDGFFQTAAFVEMETDLTGFAGSLVSGSRTLPLEAGQIRIQNSRALELSAPVLRVREGNLAEVLARPSLGGSALYVALPPQSAGENLGALTRLKPDLVILNNALFLGPANRKRLADPRRTAEEAPLFALAGGGETRQLLESDEPVTISLTVKPPKETPVRLRNVIGILPGSDPVLKDTYVMVTAHYDHIGLRTAGEDRIANGANDDASGTAGVIELAAAFGASKTRPARSLVFLTFFGEELGMVGSRYYGRNPVAPLRQTVANLNLEQIGRSDAREGPAAGTATITGFDFSDLPRVFAAAGERTGIRVYKDEKRSDAFFNRSDNQALADVGIPSHTLCVAFEYSDYHGVGDHWEKLDYPNMAQTLRMIAAGMGDLASAAPPPAWNSTNAKAQAYRDAARKLGN